MPTATELGVSIFLVQNRRDWLVFVQLPEPNPGSERTCFFIPERNKLGQRKDVQFVQIPETEGNSMDKCLVSSVFQIGVELCAEHFIG